MYAVKSHKIANGGLTDVDIIRDAERRFLHLLKDTPSTMIHKQTAGLGVPEFGAMVAKQLECLKGKLTSDFGLCVAVGDEIKIPSSLRAGIIEVIEFCDRRGLAQAAKKPV